MYLSSQGEHPQVSSLQMPQGPFGSRFTSGITLVQKRAIQAMWPPRPFVLTTAETMSQLTGGWLTPAILAEPPDVAFLLENREYYVNVASPTWAPYKYPHPLHTAYAIGSSSPKPTPAPTATPAPTPTPLPTPKPASGPAAPIITSSSSTSTSVTLTWEEADTAAGFYDIYYGT
jgi:hypothetical protein